MLGPRVAYGLAEMACSTVFLEETERLALGWKALNLAFEKPPKPEPSCWLSKPLPIDPNAGIFS